VAQGNSVEHVMDLLRRVCDAMDGNIRGDVTVEKGSIRCTTSSLTMASTMYE
jgi:hypothetical protein